VAVFAVVCRFVCCWRQKLFCFLEVIQLQKPSSRNIVYTFVIAIAVLMHNLYTFHSWFHCSESKTSSPRSVAHILHLFMGMWNKTLLYWLRLSGMLIVEWVQQFQFTALVLNLIKVTACLSVASLSQYRNVCVLLFVTMGFFCFSYRCCPNTQAASSRTSHQ
jgi:hypothetical protein